MTQKEFEYFMEEAYKVYISDPWEIKAFFSELAYKYNLYFNEELFLEECLRRE